MGKFGIIMTVLWICLFGVLIFWKWNEALQLSLNEWGDFLAGATAPIAFLWLIIGYWLQRNELQMNTEALNTQQKELSKQVEELSKQNKILEQSASHTERLVEATQNQAYDNMMYGNYKK